MFGMNRASIALIIKGGRKVQDQESWSQFVQTRSEGLQLQVTYMSLEYFMCSASNSYFAHIHLQSDVDVGLDARAYTIR